MRWPASRSTWAAPKQIGEILFGKLGLPVKRKTASGAPSTDEDVLQKLAADYPLPAKILEHRGLSKLKGTYTDKLPLMVNPDTGRVHTTYAQAVAVTGRLSSNDPNLQNIPIRTPEGRRVREAFIAPPGHDIVSADYSQIELRIMAHISGDAGLRRAFGEGMDVHRATAERGVLGGARRGRAPSSGATPRRSTSASSTAWARSAWRRTWASSEARRTPTSTATSSASRASSATWTRPSARAAQLGYVETMFGRRIELPEIRGGNGPRRAGAERQAINAPMQGTAADLIKLAMIAVQKALDDAAQAHDDGDAGARRTGVRSARRRARLGARPRCRG